MGFVHIAILGPDPDPILLGVRELGADRVAVVGLEEARSVYERVHDVLAPMKVTTEFIPVEGEMMVGTIRAVEQLASHARSRKEELVLNLGSADRRMACAGLSAAFVSGVKSFDVMDGSLRFLPVLQFSYKEVVSDAKVAILQALESLGGSCDRLKTLAKQAGISDSLVSYHIRGGRDARGLEELGLVDVRRGTRGALTIELTPMGVLLATTMEGPEANEDQ